MNVISDSPGFCFKRLIQNYVFFKDELTKKQFLLVSFWVLYLKGKTDRCMSVRHQTLSHEP